MAYNSEYPYTDATRYNSDWALNKIKDLQEQLNNIGDDIYNRSKQYTDERVSAFQNQLDNMRAELTATENRINSGFDSFKSDVLAQLLIFDSRINAFRTEINNDIIGVNARTDEAIKQNNEYLINELSVELSKLKVVNYFTGESISVQEMFDYLANLHVENGITYDELIALEKSVDNLAGLRVTYTQVAINGKLVII